MNRKLLPGLLVALFAAAPALAFDPFVVKDIRVEGIQRTEAGTVFNYLPVRVGETFTEAQAADAIRALFATGFFSDVRIETEGNVIVVVVDERAAIADITFDGVKEFDKDALKKGLREVGLAESRIFDRSLLERAEQELKRQYLSRGKYAATVTTTVTPLERNRVGINFKVDEGGVAKIRQIRIVGARAFEEEDLLDEMQLTTPGWLTWYTKNDQYSRQKLSADLETLRSWYLNQGYLDFNIDSTQVSITPDKQDIYITVNITEGEKCADAAHGLLAEWFSVVSWPGGGKADGKVDWSPLAGKEVLIWPDKDSPGWDYAIAASEAIVAVGARSCAILLPPEDRFEGWDCADAQAPSCAPRGRCAQYCSVSARLTFATGPRMCTWRPRAYHGKVTEAYGVTAS